MIEWQWKTFDELSADELYEIMKIRQEVFMIEQNCIYQDIDDLDKTAWHLTAWDTKQTNTRKVQAYLRIVFPGYKFKQPSIGRIPTVKELRRNGLGKELLRNAVLKIEMEYPNQPIRISAQQHLYKFYAQFGFEQVSEPYDEDGIVHIEMLRPSLCRNKQ
jgi:ElaA protein